MYRSYLTAIVVSGIVTIAVGGGCDSGQPRRPVAASATSAIAATSTPAGSRPVVPARVAAIGATEFLAPALRRAFDHTSFEPMPDPGPDDWLAQHPEKPQSYDAYIRGQRNIPGPQRNVIYLLPVGTPPSATRLPQLAEVVHAFFTLEVRILPAVKVAAVTAQTRINHNTNRRQLFAPEVLEWLKNRVPDDAFGLLAITTEDLYPNPSWNFVFGMASLRDRVGVQSLARHDPAFFGEPRGAGWQTLARRRAAWTLVHEVSHMFGLTHCTYWRCVVAGSNHQEESDRSPLHPCPVCLRKLHAAIKFDPAAREDALAAALGRFGLHDEAAWSTARAKWIRGAPAN